MDADHPIHPFFLRYIRAGQVCPLFITLSEEDRAFLHIQGPGRGSDHQQLTYAQFAALAAQRDWKVAYDQSRTYADPEPNVDPESTVAKILANSQ